MNVVVLVVDPLSAEPVDVVEITLAEHRVAVHAAKNRSNDFVATDQLETLRNALLWV